MNKSGFIRTLEAVIAIMVVFVFIYVISQRGFERADASVESIKSLQEEILRGLSEDESLRNIIVTLDDDFLGVDLKPYENSVEVGEILTYIKKILPSRFDERYAIVVCDTSGGCGIPYLPENENVYTSYVIVTGSLEDSPEYSPKIVRLWVW